MERSYFYDSYPDDLREYQQDDLAAFYSQIIGNGVPNTENLSNLGVTETNSMIVQLGPGWAFANGYGYNNTAALNLTHDTSDPTNDRIDRIVIRYDSSPEVRWNEAYVKKGTPSSSPVPPSLQRDSLVHELSVAQVRVIAGKSFIEQSQITDERTNQNVCGYIPLHNIYRGIEVTPSGIVNQLNQSYVEIDGALPTSFPDQTDTVLPMSSIQKDNQNEVNTANDSFVPKTDGVYLLFGYVAFDPGVIPNGSVVALSFFVNGEYVTIIDESIVVNSGKNLFVGSSVTSLNAGDELQFICRVDGGQTVSGRNLRLRVAKLY